MEAPRPKVVEEEEEEEEEDFGHEEARESCMELRDEEDKKKTEVRGSSDFVLSSSVWKLSNSEERKLIPVKMPRSLQVNPRVGCQLSKDTGQLCHVIHGSVHQPVDSASTSDMDGVSNTHLVQWSDGSWTLVVDDVYYACKLEDVGSYLVEASEKETLVCAALAPQRLNVRLLSLPLQAMRAALEGKAKKSTQLRPFGALDQSSAWLHDMPPQTSWATPDCSRVHEAKKQTPGFLNAEFLETDKDVELRKE